jgi:beta-glucanase (GH16 family)
MKVALRWFLAAAAALTMAAGCSETQLSRDVVRADAPDTPPTFGPLEWSDDFNGWAGRAPDASKWGYEVGGGGWGNNELEYYTASTDNAALDGKGHLVITARRENPAGYRCWYGACTYTSARLTTSGKFSQQYGHIEAGIKMPRGQGLWPAFWAVGDDVGRVGWPESGEIDIMEAIGSRTGTNHGGLIGPGPKQLTGTYTLPNGQSLADGFHTYAIDWSPKAVNFSVDGTVYETRTPADTKPWVFDHPFFLILNLAVGGNFPGSPDANTSFPQQMVVDYVRARSSTGGSSRIAGLGGKCVDVTDGNTANGTPVQLHTCNSTASQQWTVGSDGTIRALGKCMDVTGAGIADGSKVQLYDCNGTNAQKWTHRRTQFINTGSGKCLDAADWIDGTQLQIWACAGAHQQWTFS